VGFGTQPNRLANESLDATRSAFEAEKADFAKLSAEQSEAFEALNSAHEKLRGEFNQLQAHATRMETENKGLADGMRQATEAANIAEMRVQEKVVMIAGRTNRNTNREGGCAWQVAGQTGSIASAGQRTNSDTQGRSWKRAKKVSLKISPIDLPIAAACSRPC
jgi:hypothetical protein